MRMSAETAHTKTLQALRRISCNSRLTAIEEKAWGSKVPSLPVRVFDREFRNPVGLAAGFDKNAVAIPALDAMGFGFVEVGTVTPRPQLGNSGKRIFRVVEDEAIINRLGFNSDGLDAFRNNLETYRSRFRSAPLGVNISKNTHTPNEKAVIDYAECFESVYEFADYVVLNVSSPNSPGLRDLQASENFRDIIENVMQMRKSLESKFGERIVPVAVKISPDLQYEDLKAIAANVLYHKVDAIIATNTTVQRPNRTGHRNYRELGGLSGKPLTDLSTEVIGIMAEAVGFSLPIIGVGGISTAEDAWNKFLAGASLVQLYTSLVYQGPAVINKIVCGVAERAKKYDEDFETAVKLARADHKRKT